MDITLSIIVLGGVNIDFIERQISVGAPSMQWWAQLSTSIVFGLGFATVLTLVVTPCALMIKVNFHDWQIKRRESPENAATK